MSHTIHTTRALVLGSAPVQDADKLLWLLTEDLGLVFASAKSVREETSKLRYALQDLAQPCVSLVRGRELWRVTGAEEQEKVPLRSSEREVFGRIATLVRRVMPIGEVHRDIFVAMYNARGELATVDTHIQSIEHVTVARILYRLGYLPLIEEYRGLVDTLHFDAVVCAHGARVHKRLVHDINAGLAESQL